MPAAASFSAALIYPPVAKAAEPPAGVARLCAALKSHGVACRVIDANLKGMLFLLHKQKMQHSSAPQHRRVAEPQRLRAYSTYGNFSRHQAAVLDLVRALQAAGRPFDASISLTDFASNRSPLSSADLIDAADHFDDNPFFPYFEEELRPQLEALQPSLIGISLIYLSQALTAFALIGWLRHRFPNTRIIVGGGLMTSWMSGPNWNAPFRGLIDTCVAGPGEEALLRELGAPPSAKRFPPNYDDVLWEEYLSPGRILPYSASDGCWWRRCRFCPEAAEENRFVSASPDEVIADLKLLRRYRPALIHFLDNALTPALLKRLAEEPPAAPWYGYARFTEELTDLSFVRRLRRSGCVMLQLGLESGDQKVLDAMNKGIRLSEASVVLKNLQKAGIAAYVYVLFGTPWETRAQAERTLDFVEAHADSIRWLNVALFNLPAAGREAAAYPIRPFYSGDLTLYYDFEHPEGWNRAVVRRFLQSELRRRPKVRRLTLGRPQAFTSNHAPFFTDHFAVARAHADRLAV